jgi:DNA-binding beta-propeller fold protein YncE
MLAAAAFFVLVPAADALISTGENASDILDEFASASSDTTPDYVKNCPNNGASPIGFYYPAGNAIDGTNHWLFTTDGNNSRVLVFPLTTGNLLSSKTPSYVLGQPNTTSCTTQTTSQSSLDLVGNPYEDNPEQPCVDPTHQYLFMPDYWNNRVMIFNTASMSNGMNATYELGQPSGTAFTSSSTAVSKSGLDAPTGCAYDTTTSLLYVADSLNNRVVVFNTSTIANGMNATYVLGQSSFTANGEGTTIKTMYQPVDIAIDSTHHYAFVSDMSNNRVLVFNDQALSATGENASYVIGQTSMTAGSEDEGGSGPTQSSLDNPSALAFDSTNTRLFVNDTSGENDTNNRVMVFNTSSITNGMNAAFVLGEPDFVTNYNNYTVGAVYNPEGVAYDSTNSILYVNSTSLSNTMIFDIPATSLTPSAVGQSGADGCVIAGGELFCGGWNQEGEDGLGTTQPVYVFQRVGSLTNWTAISMGYQDYEDDRETCGIAGGALYCWGANSYGELGLGSGAVGTNYPTPQQVGSATNWIAISTGGWNTCGIRGSSGTGALYCWGKNANGEDGTTCGSPGTSCSSPAQVGSLTTWSAVSTSGNNTCAIQGTPTGTLWCWGANANGEDGPGCGAPGTSCTAPTQVGTVSTWSTVAEAGNDTCGINASGKLFCWGANSYEQDSTTCGEPCTSTTTQPISSITNWTIVTDDNSDGGGGDVCGVAGGTAYCWGQNIVGELGSTAPVLPSGKITYSGTWTALVVGSVDFCGIKSSALYCWGANQQGNDDTGAQGVTYTTPQGPFSVPQYNGIQAADLMGHYTSVSSTATVNWNAQGSNNGPNPLGTYIGLGATLDPVHHYLFTSDNGNNRVMIYALNSDNSFVSGSGGHTASFVLGATDLFNSGTNDNSASTLGQPGGVAVDPTNQRLFVADDGDNRVMVYNTAGLGTSPGGGGSFNNSESASYILSSGNGCTATEMNYPPDVAYDAADTYLFVADGENNRVLVFNVAPTAITNSETPLYVLGQSSATSCTAHTTQAGMNYPMSVAYDGVNKRLFVADGDNNRVLVFKAPFSNGMNATNVIGQTSFTTASTGSGMNQLQLPDGVSYDPTNSRLFVADCDNARVLVYSAASNGFNPLPTNNASATVMLGTGSYGLTQSSLILCDTGNNGPINPIMYDPNTSRLFVPDKFNNRVMIFDGSFLGGTFFPMLPD